MRNYRNMTLVNKTIPAAEYGHMPLCATGPASSPKARVFCDPFLLALASWDLWAAVDERGACSSESLQIRLRACKLVLSTLDSYARSR